MKRTYKIAAWIAAGVVLLAVCLIGCFVVKAFLNRDFAETRIYPDENRVAPADTVFNINGIPVKMVGVRGGRIDCQGLNKTIELDDFYIGETEVTQDLWSAIMGDNPSMHKGDSLPVEYVDLIDCLKFVNRLDSVTEHNFYIPTYPEWLYAAHLGNKQSDLNNPDRVAWHKGNANHSTHAVKQKSPNSMGIYDMFGNVAEWTISGADPLFVVAGGSYNDRIEKLDADLREFDHGEVKMATMGLRLVLYPRK